MLYNGNSPNGYSRKQTALLAVAFTKPVFLNSYTESVFLHSRKQLAPVTDTFCASWGCLLTRASTVFVMIHPNTVAPSVRARNPEKPEKPEKSFFEKIKGRHIHYICLWKQFQIKSFRLQLSDLIPRKVVMVVTYCNSVIKIITLKKGKAILPSPPSPSSRRD